MIKKYLKYTALIVCLVGAVLPTKVNAIDYTDKLQDAISERYNIPEEKSVEYTKYIVNSAQKHKLDPYLLAAVIGIESRYNPKVDKGYGIGLMQVVYGVHKDKVSKKSQLFNPETNIIVGTKILSDAMNRSKNNVRVALRKYNGSATHGYSTKVMTEMNMLKGI